MYQWHFEVIYDYYQVFLDGAWITTQLTIVSFVIGIVLGLFLALARLSGKPLISIPATIYIEALRATPALVQLVWIYYALPIITGIRLDSFSSLCLGLGLHEAAY